LDEFAAYKPSGYFQGEEFQPAIKAAFPDFISLHSTVFLQKQSFIAATRKLTPAFKIPLL